MIAYAGMSEKLPNLCYYSNDEYSFSKPYSERTAELIDEEVKRMINEQYDRAKAILSEHKDGHNELARLLVEKEVIFAEDVERIFGNLQILRKRKKKKKKHNIVERSVNHNHVILNDIKSL